MLLKKGYVFTHSPGLTKQALPLVLTCECGKLQVRSEQFGTNTDYCEVFGA